MASVVVIGAGVGGLCTALRLRSAGHDVVVFERNTIGGKLHTKEWNGFRFDTGPSLLTLPDVFEDTFNSVGKHLSDYVEVMSLEQPFEYRFWEGDRLRTYDEPEDTFNAFEEFSPKAGEQWNQFMHRAERIWDISERTFFAGPLDSWREILKRIKSPMDLLHIDSLTALAGRAEQSFNDKRLQTWVNRYATYSGSNPFTAPATLSCIPFIEQAFGCWHVRGGLGNLSNALRTICEEAGVNIYEGVEVRRIAQRNGQVVGVRTSQGDVRADIVVSDIDAGILYSKLWPDAAIVKQLEKAQASSSVLAISVALADTTPDASHHTVWFSENQTKEFQAIFGKPGWTRDCTIYACNPAVTDPTMAPAGQEAWTMLVNVGAGTKTDWTALAASILERSGIASRVLHFEMTTPEDIEQRYGNPGGSIYGTSSNTVMSAFRRASNRGPIKGLYLTGGSAHPGGGLPLVAMSARIVADAIATDQRR